jgi:hypothetical protein
VIHRRAVRWVVLAVGVARAASAAPDATSATSAHGEPTLVSRPFVAVVATGGDADPLVVEAVNRLRLELAAAGLLVPEPTQAPDYTVAIGRADDRLVAEVRASAGARARAGGRAALPSDRRVDLARTTDVDRASVAAIRAVELLRATMLQYAAPVEAGRAAGSPPVAAGAPAAPLRPIDPGRLFEAGLGLAAFQSLGGINTGFAVGSRIGVLLGRSLSLEIKLTTPAIARDRSVAEGSVSVAQMMGGLGIGYGLGARRRLQPSLSLLGGYYWAGFRHHPLVGQDVSADVFSPFVSVGAGLAVLTWEKRGSLRLEADAVFVEPALHVTLGSTDVGRTGRPLLLVTLRVDRSAAFHTTR